MRFDLAAPNRWVAVFFFKSIILVKRHSDFLALSLLNGVGAMGDLGLLLVNLSGVETIAASRTSLNFCLLSHLPAYLYHFLGF